MYLENIYLPPHCPFVMAGGDEAFFFDEKNCPPLWKACKNGFYDVAYAEIEDDCVDVDQRGGRYNTTALMVAAFYGRVSTVELLLGANADMSLRDDRGLTASHLATKAGQMQIVSILAVSGDDIDAMPGIPVKSCKRGRFTPMQ
jgi:ankyrin repeat protein